MQTQKKPEKRAAEPDPKHAEAWQRVVEQAKADAEKAPETYLKDSAVPAGGE